MPECPLLDRQRSLKPVLKIAGREIYGGASPPSVVVGGESGYRG